MYFHLLRGRGGGGVSCVALMWWLTLFFSVHLLLPSHVLLLFLLFLCVCVYVCVCVFFFWGGGGGCLILFDPYEYFKLLSLSLTLAWSQGQCKAKLLGFIFLHSTDQD